jgi:polysaccharide export outer membrane protein
MKHILITFWGLIWLATTSFAQDSNYQVQPGDTLLIEVLEDTSLNRSVLVTPDGSFAFPFAGSLRVAGLTVNQIRANIVSSIEGNFVTPPNVFVSVASLRPDEEEDETMNVYFVGEVNTPGLREVALGTTFLQALSEAGGFTNFAATKRLQLRRTNTHTGAQSLYKINYHALSLGAGLRKSIFMRPGDVILVPERRLFE